MAIPPAPTAPRRCVVCGRSASPIEQLARDPRAGLRVTVAGRGPRGLLAPATVLDAGNSGSTMRMLAGILAAHPFRASMTGDDSLRRRPMRRIIVPLERMGARIALVGRPAALAD